MLKPEELQALAVQLLTGQPVARLGGLVFQIIRGRRTARHQDHPVLGQIEQALGQRTGDLERYPEALFSQVYNYLAWSEAAGVETRAFAEGELRLAMTATGRPWLHAEARVPSSAETVFRGSPEVRCLARFDEETIITGHEDGTVRRWQRHAHSFEILYRHEGSVSNGMDLSTSLFGQPGSLRPSRLVQEGILLRSPFPCSWLGAVGRSSSR